MAIVFNGKNQSVSKARGFSWLGRRLQQLSKVLFSPAFSSPGHRIDATTDRYAAPDEVQFYTEAVAHGLAPDEKEAIPPVQALRKPLAASASPSPPTALVVGCGAGREVFALEQMGYRVCGTDTCASMIETACRLASARHSHTQFFLGSWPPEPPAVRFDLVFITANLMGHIPGRRNRIEFLRTATHLLAPGGQICVRPDIFPLKTNDRYYWISRALQIRHWLTGSEWERGDTARAYLGNHTDNPHPVFFHYYPSEEEFKKEIEEAGLLGRKLPLGFWRAERETMESPRKIHI